MQTKTHKTKQLTKQPKVSSRRFQQLLRRSIGVGAMAMLLLVVLAGFDGRLRGLMQSFYVQSLGGLDIYLHHEHAIDGHDEALAVRKSGASAVSRGGAVRSRLLRVYLKVPPKPASLSGT